MDAFNFAERAFWESAPNPLSSKLCEIRLEKSAVLDLTVSNPTQSGFEYLKEDLLAPLENTSANLAYYPNPHGTSLCRRAIQHYYTKKNCSISDEQIFVTANTSEAYSFIFKLLMNQGDTLLAPTPSYPLIDYLGGLHDLNVERYVLESEESILSPALQSSLKPKAFLAVQPNNPTGHMLSGAFLERLMNQLCRISCPLISDEVFLDYLLDEEARTETCARESSVLSFTVSGISKVLGLPQMKLSWIIINGPQPLLTQAIHKMEVIADTYLSASTPIQNAAPYWFSKMESIQNEIRARIHQNLEQLKNILPQSALPEFSSFQGGWAIPVRLNSCLSDEDWALKLLEEENLLVHPGYLYDFDDSSHIVLSLLTAPNVFKNGLAKIVKKSAFV